ncbi:putative orfan [Tupanvirus soda lake]|uniref:Orfan n=2 Tax=Tupanvirus TaxID=2094720 RepID=A0AC62ABE8_9VIRU|nr:putative orfan [Tupanvirus soda lake]QKU35014.1 putative orfan [Tupanvirus soda lake]
MFVKKNQVDTLYNITVNYLKSGGVDFIHSLCPEEIYYIEKYFPPITSIILECKLQRVQYLKQLKIAQRLKKLLNHIPRKFGHEDFRFDDNTFVEVIICKKECVSMKIFDIVYLLLDITSSMDHAFYEYEKKCNNETTKNLFITEGKTKHINNGFYMIYKSDNGNNIFNINIKNGNNKEYPMTSKFFYKNFYEHREIKSPYIVSIMVDTHTN